MSIKIATSFDVGSNVPVDDRLVMNSTELKNVNDNTMPDSYLCVCPDLDGKIFIYNKAFELDPEFGRFRPFSGDNSIITTESEFLALPEEERLNNSYYLYDIGVHYKNGVAYSRKKPIQLTMEEYKALKEAGAIDEQQEYLIEANEQGILLGAEDIGYNNAESGIQATTVQGAIDKVVNEVVRSYFYPTGAITDIEVGENGAIYITVRWIYTSNCQWSYRCSRLC